MKHLFIINPEAGKGKTLSYIPIIEELCNEQGLEYIIEITEGPGDATKIAREYTEKEKLRVYSVGGDGTLNEVLNGMIGSGSSLAVIPSGSGNDFIRNLSSDGSVKEILMRSIQGATMSVDLGRFNDKYFINISSAGLDAEIVYKSIKLKKLPFIPSKFAYLLSIFITVFGYRSRKLKVIMDNKELNTETLLVAVANGRFYGGGMKVAPGAEISDGFFDICHVKKVGAFKVIRLLPKLIKGVHGNINEVSFYKARKVRIICDEEISINVDGELFRMKEVFFEIIPKAIDIVHLQDENQIGRQLDEAVVV